MPAGIKTSASKTSLSYKKYPAPPPPVSRESSFKSAGSAASGASLDDSPLNASLENLGEGGKAPRKPHRNPSFKKYRAPAPPGARTSESEGGEHALMNGIGEGPCAESGSTKTPVDSNSVQEDSAGGLKEKEKTKGELNGRVGAGAASEEDPKAKDSSGGEIVEQKATEAKSEGDTKGKSSGSMRVGKSPYKKAPEPPTNAVAEKRNHGDDLAKSEASSSEDKKNNSKLNAEDRGSKGSRVATPDPGQKVVFKRTVSGKLASLTNKFETEEKGASKDTSKSALKSVSMTKVGKLGNLSNKFGGDKSASGLGPNSKGTDRKGSVGDKLDKTIPKPFDAGFTDKNVRKRSIGGIDISKFGSFVKPVDYLNAQKSKKEMESDKKHETDAKTADLNVITEPIEEENCTAENVVSISDKETNTSVDKPPESVNTEDNKSEVSRDSKETEVDGPRSTDNQDALSKSDVKDAIESNDENNVTETVVDTSKSSSDLGENDAKCSLASDQNLATNRESNSDQDILESCDETRCEVNKGEVSVPERTLSDLSKEDNTAGSDANKTLEGESISSSNCRDVTPEILVSSSKTTDEFDSGNRVTADGSTTPQGQSSEPATIPVKEATEKDPGFKEAVHEAPLMTPDKEVFEDALEALTHPVSRKGLEADTPLPSPPIFSDVTTSEKPSLVIEVGDTFLKTEASDVPKSPLPDVASLVETGENVSTEPHEDKLSNLTVEQNSSVIQDEEPKTGDVLCSESEKALPSSEKTGSVLAEKIESSFNGSLMKSESLREKSPHGDISMSKDASVKDLPTGAVASASNRTESYAESTPLTCKLDIPFITPESSSAMYDNELVEQVSRFLSNCETKEETRSQSVETLGAACAQGSSPEISKPILVDETLKENRADDQCCKLPLLRPSSIGAVSFSQMRSLSDLGCIQKVVKIATPTPETKPEAQLSVRPKTRRRSYETPAVSKEVLNISEILKDAEERLSKALSKNLPRKLDPELHVDAYDPSQFDTLMPLPAPDDLPLGDRQSRSSTPFKDRTERSPTPKRVVEQTEAMLTETDRILRKTRSQHSLRRSFTRSLSGVNINRVGVGWCPGSIVVPRSSAFPIKTLFTSSQIVLITCLDTI